MSIEKRITEKAPEQSPNAKLGEAFLNATNPWLRNPNGDPKNLLSDRAKDYLFDIQRELDNVKIELIKSNGQNRIEPKPFGMSLDEYLEMIKSSADNIQDYVYIKELTDSMVGLIDMMEIELPYQAATGSIDLLEKLQTEVKRVAWKREDKQQSLEPYVQGD